jgi:5-oxoprolinase (ATP-hydrolysing)
VFETTTAGITIQAPQLDISTVAAGGGSRLFFQNGLFVVGPESVGAHPGPVCYRKPGGMLAITDANLVLGRVQPEFFPRIFGPQEDLPLDREASVAAFETLTAEINGYAAEQHRAAAKAAGVDVSGAGGAGGWENPADVLTVEDVAAGFLRVANEAMCR